MAIQEMAGPRRKRTLVTYLLTLCAIALWHVYNSNWFGMLSLYDMGGGVALFAIECNRLDGRKTT